MGKTIAIIQSNYIPWKGYFDLIRHADILAIYDSCQYTKNDWRNRNLIKTPDGVKWLTIPVYHNLSMRIDQVIVKDKKWKVNHWKTIEQFYSHSLYFKEYKEHIKSLYDNCNYLFLSEINQYFIRYICQLLGITTQIIDISQYELTGEKTGKLVDVCKLLGADRYVSGPAAQCYLDVELMNKNGISVTWMKYDYPEYKQMYPPFNHGVSVIDLIFNCGGEAMRYVA